MHGFDFDQFASNVSPDTRRQPDQIKIETPDSKASPMSK
jgi:hypothetical protein